MKLIHEERLPRHTKKQEDKMREEISKQKFTMSDRLLMVGTAFVWILLPCALILVLICVLALALFGLL